MHAPKSLVLALAVLLAACSEAPVAHAQPEPSQTPRLVEKATSSPVPIAPVAASPTPAATASPSVAPTPSTYVAQSGDSLSLIAKKTNMTVDELVRLNPGSEVNRDQVCAGDTLALSQGAPSRLCPRSTPPPAPAISAHTPIVGVLWTFDDCEYGSQGIVARYLQVLRSHGVGYGIFFMTGQCYYSRPDLVALIKNSGSEIGNHTKSHADLTKLTSAQIDAEIKGGPPSRYFRPPYGAENDLVRQRVAAAGLTSMRWSATGGDSGTEGIKRGCDRILQDLVTTIASAQARGYRPVVLLHMFNSSSPLAVDAYLAGRSAC